MKYIITESQLNMLIPPKLKRKYAVIHSLTNTLFNDEDIRKTMEYQAQKKSFPEFLDFVLNFIENWLVMDTTAIDSDVIRNSIKVIIHDRIEKFWNEANTPKKRFERWFEK
mgnify:FL=1